MCKLRLAGARLATARFQGQELRVGAVTPDGRLRWMRQESVFSAHNALRQTTQASVSRGYAGADLLLIESLVRYTEFNTPAYARAKHLPTLFYIQILQHSL